MHGLSPLKYSTYCFVMFLLKPPFLIRAATMAATMGITAERKSLPMVGRPPYLGFVCLAHRRWLVKGGYPASHEGMQANIDKIASVTSQM